MTIPYGWKTLISQYEERLIEAAHQIILNLTKKKDAKDICAFALYLDESGSSISASANTVKHLAKLQKEDAEEYVYYKWSPAEWKSDSIASERLDQLSEQLSLYSMELEGSDFDRYTSELFDRTVKVLLTLKKEGAFNEFHEKCIVLFDVSDYENTNSQIEWVKELNDEAEAAEFEEWLKSEGN